MSGETERTVCWVHGWGASPSIWRDAANRFLPEYRHLFFSYAGCKTIDEFRGKAREMIFSDPAPAAVIGWSLGGILIMEAGLRPAYQTSANGEFKGKIVLVGTTLKFVDRDRTKGWPARIVDRMDAQLREDSTAVLRHFRLNMLSPEEEQRFSGSFPGDGTCDFSAEGLEAGLSYLKSTDLTSLSGALSARGNLLWVHGSDDPICPSGAVPHLPDRSLCILSGAGHVPFLTQPELFYDRLRGFLHDDR